MGVRALKFFREVVQDKFTAEAPWTGVAAEVVGIMGLAEAEAEGGGEQEATALTTIGETFDEIPISLARENFRQKMLSCGCGPSSYPFTTAKPSIRTVEREKDITCDIFVHGPDNMFKF